VKGAGVVGPLHAVSFQRVVDHLRSVLTRQTLLQTGVDIVQDTSRARVTQGVGRPSSAGQAGLVSIVACQNEQHLRGLYTGYSIIRTEGVVAIAGDNALGLTE